jgi:hypothetical protein
VLVADLVVALISRSSSVQLNVETGLEVSERRWFEMSAASRIDHPLRA